MRSYLIASKLTCLTTYNPKNMNKPARSQLTRERRQSWISLRAADLPAINFHRGPARLVVPAVRLRWIALEGYTVPVRVRNREPLAEVVGDDLDYRELLRIYLQCQRAWAYVQIAPSYSAVDIIEVLGLELDHGAARTRIEREEDGEASIYDGTTTKFDATMVLVPDHKTKISIVEVDRGSEVHVVEARHELCWD
jgi:hypothetical protein